MEKKRLSSIDDVKLSGAKLGSGSHAQVKLVHHKELNKMFALKTVDISTIGDQKHILNECEVHKRLHHPNIIEYSLHNSQARRLLGRQQQHSHLAGIRKQRRPKKVLQFEKKNDTRERSLAHRLPIIAIA